MGAATEDRDVPLRTALGAAGYTSTGIADRIGPMATAALGRNDLRAALSATAGADDPLATLIRLFVCGEGAPPDPVAAALAPLPLADAVLAGIVEEWQTGLRAGVEIEAYGDQWIVSDVDATMRPGRPLPLDHVLGVGGASTTLAQSTIRRPVGTALDLGTGCGVQALHLSAHADRVTATDLSTRALRFAATTADLNGVDWELPNPSPAGGSTWS
jgi:Methyltransferase small domain